MKAAMRFGRKIPLPSTLQIVHELRAFCAEEDIRERCAEEDGLPVASSWNAICVYRAGKGTA
jgi:hypothetical protein